MSTKDETPGATGGGRKSLMNISAVDSNMNIPAAPEAMITGIRLPEWFGPSVDLPSYPDTLYRRGPAG